MHRPLKSTRCSSRNFSIASIEVKLISRETARHLSTDFGTRASCSLLGFDLNCAQSFIEMKLNVRAQLTDHWSPPTEYRHYQHRGDSSNSLIKKNNKMVAGIVKQLANLQFESTEDIVSFRRHFDRVFVPSCTLRWLDCVCKLQAMFSPFYREWLNSEQELYSWNSILTI